MLNPGRLKCWKKLIVSLIGASAIATAIPVEARPIIIEESRYLGPVPYQGPTITHIPMRSVSGSNVRRYYYSRDSYPSYPNYSRIRRSTLVNPTVIDSQISDSILINPVIVNPPVERRYYRNSPVERRYYRSRGGYLRYVSPGVQIQIGH